jgi:hypothetical protein
LALTLFVLNAEVTIARSTTALNEGLSTERLKRQQSLHSRLPQKNSMYNDKWLLGTGEPFLSAMTADTKQNLSLNRIISTPFIRPEGEFPAHALTAAWFAPY